MEFATALLPKLAKLLLDEYKLQKGAREGINFLYKELEAMQGALEIISEVPIEQLDRNQRTWARDVRDLSCDMEDIVDTFMVDVQGPNPPSKSGAKKIFKKMIRKVTKAMARREVAQEVKDIKERAKELAERRDRYKVDNIAPAKKTPVDPRLQALYTDMTKIVGIKEAKKEVITMLTDGDSHQQKRIVSIAGFGGLGKTTLAKAVYDTIKNDFDCTAIVSVSRHPDTMKLLKDMLYQLDKEEFKNIHNTMLDERLLIDEAIEFLKNKRYLIVIDDIWDKEPWDRVIGLSLIENNMRSRIITTTRNIDVAEHVGGSYRLKPLSDKSSEMLFYGRIFGSQDKCPRQFFEVSEKILKKCGGVPLAIITTSSLLANKSRNIKMWDDVCDSIGMGLGRNNPRMDDMRKILLLSYYDLPSHLKTCVLYLSIFPEDYEISKDRLIWRWIAEGFVQQGQRAAGDQISFHEIGENYYNELVNRSLIQPVDMDGMEGIPKACRLHDTVLDLIISLSEEENFITTALHDGMESKVRWLSLHNNSSWPTVKMPKLRSLTIFKPDDDIEIDRTPHLRRYGLLRVLDLQGCKLEDLASLGFLGSLLHLRYLALSTDIDLFHHFGFPDELPIEIGKLRFLQTLDLSETVVLELSSGVITGLGQLMCLRGRDGCFMLPYGLKNLTSLEVLEWATVTSKCIAEELGHLTKLRILDVNLELGTLGDYECRAYARALLESLAKLAKIESIRIHTSYTSSDLCIDLDGPLQEPLANLHQLCIDKAMFLPTWIRDELLPGLSYLDIEVEYERKEDIQVLGMLSGLRHLQFRVVKAPEEKALERCMVGPDGFPRAIRCVFDIAAGDLVPSMFPRGAMPMLEDFLFRVRLQDFRTDGGWIIDDLGLGHLPSLRNVVVLGLDDSDDDETIIEKEMMRSVRKKLENEAALHPNHPNIISSNLVDEVTTLIV